MAQKKLTIGLSHLTDRVYIGSVNPSKPTEWVGEKIDITSQFIEVMLKKYGPDKPEDFGAQSVINCSDGSKFEVKITRKA